MICRKTMRNFVGQWYYVKQWQKFCTVAILLIIILCFLLTFDSSPFFWEAFIDFCLLLSEGAAPSATPARFSGPVCDLFDNNVIICTKTLNRVCLFCSLVSRLVKNMYSSHQQMLSKCSSLAITSPCKRYLEESNKASNVACRAELGRFPLIIAINQKIMNYSSYLLSKDNCSIVKQIFLMSQDLHHASEKSYYSNIISMSKYYNFPWFDITYLTDAKIKHYVSLMQQKYILHWQRTMQNSTKLEFFNTFKNDYAPSSYLGLTNKLSERKELVKLRIGNHKLRLRPVDMTKFQGLIDFALFVHLIKLRTNLSFLYIAINILF